MNQLRTVEAYVVGTVKQEQLPGEIPSCPLSAEARQLLLAECPVIVTDPASPELRLDYTPPADVKGYDVTDWNLVQPSAIHCRSFELVNDGLGKWWHDEFGNRYSSFNLKGNNFSKPGVLEHPTACDGYVAWGLQESKIIERVLRASQVLRERGVGTEFIVGLAEPKQYPWPLIDNDTNAHELIGLSEYKQRIIGNYFRELPEDRQTMEFLAELTTKFNDMTFYISMRAADSAYRAGDLTSIPVREKIFAEVNANGLKPGDKPLEADRISDHVRYLRDYFAPVAGRNLARIHKDLSHGFAHSFNMTAYGSFVDLDSIHGTGLDMGDEPITDFDRAEDIMRALHELQETVMYGNIFDEGDGMVNSFVSHYFSETGQVFGEKAMDHLANVIAAAEDLMTSESSWLSSKAKDLVPILQIMKQRYFEMYFSGSEYADALSLQNQKIDALLNVMGEVPDEPLTDVVREVLEHNVERYAHGILTDGINNLRDETFDPFVSFMLNPSQSDGYIDMRHDIESMIRVTTGKHFSDRTAEYLPTIEDPATRRIVIDVLLTERESAMRAAAQKLIYRALPRLAPALREACTFDRPQSLLPGASSELYLGAKKQFWLATESVAISEISSLLLANQATLQTIYMPEIAKQSASYKASPNAHLKELLTDGAMDGHLGESNYSAMKLDLSSDEKASYILFVEETTEGKQLYRLCSNDVRLLARFQKPNSVHMLPDSDELQLV